MRHTSLFFISLNCLASEEVLITYPEFQNSRIQTHQFKHMQTNTGILVDDINLQQRPLLEDKILSIYYGHQGNRHVCENEPYINEVSVGDCSGVLIKPDLVATAGHCVDNNIWNKSWFFNYQQGDELNNKIAYKVKRIIYQDFNMIKVSYSPHLQIINKQRIDKHMTPLPPDIYNYSMYRDIALLKLDKNVSTFSPVNVNYEPFVKGKRAISIGHPLGISLKYGDSGKLTGMGNAHYMVSTIRTLKGNSGGPLYDVETGELIGITVNKGLYHHFGLKANQRCYGFTKRQTADVIAQYSLEHLSGHMSLKLLKPLID